MRELAQRCESGRFDNPLEAMQCLGLCGGTGGTCRVAFSVTAFRKLACASAAPTGQPGWNCDYYINWTANNAQMRQVLGAVMPSGTVANGRFIRSDVGWLLLAPQ